jgi:hypothetical protein
MPSGLAAAEAATAPSAARSVCASPLYRGAIVALFLSGLGTSAAAPQITLFLVNDLHVSLTTAAPESGSGCSGGVLWRDSSGGSRWPWPTRCGCLS